MIYIILTLKTRCRMGLESIYYSLHVVSRPILTLKHWEQVWGRGYKSQGCLLACLLAINGMHMQSIYAHDY